MDFICFDYSFKIKKKESPFFVCSYVATQWFFVRNPLSSLFLPTLFYILPRVRLQCLEIFAGSAPAVEFKFAASKVVTAVCLGAQTQVGAINLP